MCAMSEKDCPFYKKIDEMHKSVRQVEVWMKGNGEPGIFEMIRKNQTAIENNQKALETLFKDRDERYRCMSNRIWKITEGILLWAFRTFLVGGVIYIAKMLLPLGGSQ